MPGPNIAQIEFFHVGGPGVNSLQDLMKECHERAADGLEMTVHGHQSGTGIKTVIRIYDHDGCLTKLAIMANKQKRTVEELEEYVRAGSWMQRYWINLRSKWRARKRQGLSQKIARVSSTMVLESIEASYAVAVEKFDRSFRYMLKSEAHEVSQRVRKYTDVWLFIFRPNDLLADSNTSVTSTALV